MKIFKLILMLVMSLAFKTSAMAKEIALTFDDAPVDSTGHFETFERSQILIKKLRALKVPPVMIFANGCKRGAEASVLEQLKMYKEAGHYIGNHTCSHPRLDDVGFEPFVEQIALNDKLLSSILIGQKFFRYPYLNEGSDEKLRNKVRAWLIQQNYRHGMVSIDDDDYVFSFKINDAKTAGKKIDYDKIKKLFLEHMLGAAEFYDNLAVTSLGYSPKHVMLLHEMDATVMFIDSLVGELRARGWKIIDAKEAYQDKLYLENPNNTYGNNGIIAQVDFEKTGVKKGYWKYEEVVAELDKILGL